MSEDKTALTTDVSTVITKRYARYELRDNIAAIEEYVQIDDNGEIGETKLVDKFFAMLSPNKIKKLTRKNAYKDVICRITDKERFEYFRKSDLEKFRNALGTNTDEFYKVWRSIENHYDQIDYIKLIRRKDFDWTRLLRFESYNHMIYRIDGKVITRPKKYDYIYGGITSSEFNNLDKVFEVLKKHKYVYGVEKIDIPYYNRDCGSRAIEFILDLPQELFDEFYEKAVKQDKEYWSVRLWELVADHHWGRNDNDFLGIKKFKRTEEEKEEISRDWRDDDDDDW